MMVDINEALMRRSKIAPAKRKRSSAPKKIASSGAGVSKNGLTMKRFSKPLDVLSLPTAKTTVSRPSSPQPSTSSVSFHSPQATVPTTQAYIDLGQKGFGKHVTCRKCGLLYTAGEEEDEREHKRFCKDRQRGITVAKWKNERLLKTFSDDARIIEVRADDAPVHVKKLLEVKEVLDDALGFVSKSVFLQRGQFLFIEAKQIVGSVTVERIENAIVLDKENKTTISSEGSSSIPQPDESREVAALLGICQLWVHPDFRHKRIATRLVDVVREKYIYGLRIPKNQVAFAQPTRNGLDFATSYVSPHPVLVYEGATTPSVCSKQGYLS